MWSKIGKEGSIFDISWPKYDEDAIQLDEMELIVQVNGKLRNKIMVASDISQEDMKTAALEDEKIKDFIGDKNVVKVIAIPGKLVNIVIK